MAFFLLCYLWVKCCSTPSEGQSCLFVFHSVKNFNLWPCCISFDLMTPYAVQVLNSSKQSVYHSDCCLTWGYYSSLNWPCSALKSPVMRRFLHAIFSISLPTSWHMRQSCRGLGHQVVSAYSRQWTDLNLGKRRKQVSQCLEAANWGFQNKAVNTISCEYSDTMNKARKLVPVVKHSQHEVLT